MLFLLFANLLFKAVFKQVSKMQNQSNYSNLQSDKDNSQAQDNPMNE